MRIIKNDGLKVIMIKKDHFSHEFMSKIYYKTILIFECHFLYYSSTILSYWTTTLSY